MTRVLPRAHEAPRLPMLVVQDHELYWFRSDTPLSPKKLSMGERRVYNGIKVERRLTEWLTGRSALKAAAAAAGVSVDTSCLKLPHRWLSLTHCAGTAIAVCAEPRGAGAVLGAGVDFERDRLLNRETLHFFANDEELTGLDTNTNATILRLWTIKEAAFKACPDNRCLVLADFVIRDLCSDGSGQALVRPGNRRVFFSSYRYDGGWLSLALSLED